MFLMGAFKVHVFAFCIETSLECEGLIWTSGIFRDGWIDGFYLGFWWDTDGTLYTV